MKIEVGDYVLIVGDRLEIPESMGNVFIVKSNINKKLKIVSIICDKTHWSSNIRNCIKLPKALVILLTQCE